MPASPDVIRADHDPKFYYRFIFMSLAAFALALWSLYDGYVTYPNQRERALAFQQFDEENRTDEWPAYARERGWPEEAPGEAKSEADITMQFIMAGMAAFAGVVLLFIVWRARGRWIEADETGITSSWGQSLQYDQVLALDKRHWRNKGIARIRYQDGRRKRRFVLDNYKFDRENTDAILFNLEGYIGYDKIVNGPPEPTEVEYDDDAEDDTDEPSPEDASEANRRDH